MNLCFFLVIFLSGAGQGDEIPTIYPSARRIVAFGDVHGDLAATRTALHLAGAIDTEDRWIGGDLVVVQTGDQLDRGDDEQAILDLFSRLMQESQAAGGQFIPLNGNHELMNVYLDFRYVTDGGFKDFPMPEDMDLQSLNDLPEEQRARAAVFRPGGPYALKLAQRNVVIQIGDTVFVHGGVLPEHIDFGIEKINSQIRAWLRGEIERPARELGFEQLVWTRLYSNDPDAGACKILSETLEKLGARRMVVGHTVQEKGITSFCDQKVWCIDVGLAAYYGGKPQVLEIIGDQVRQLGQ